MRILWMKPILPYPPRQGTRRVTLQFLTHLSSRHRIRLFTRLLDPAEEMHVTSLRRRLPELEVCAVLAPNRRSWLHRAGHRVRSRLAARRGIPPVEWYTALPELRRRFRAEAQAFRPDLVVAEYWYAASYLEDTGAPGVLFAHDLDFLARSGPAAEGAESGRAGALQEIEARRERAALRNAPFLWFLTAADRDRAVRKLDIDPERTRVVPYGIDLEGALAPRRDDDPPEDPERVLLFGSFHADFNRDALGFTLDEVLPALRRLLPSARLHVAGGGLGAAERRRCRRAGCRVEGEVSDVRSTLLRSAVILVPLRFGGGLRIRLLESLALERTVVGTPVGVLGMGPEAEREVLVGRTGAELAGQVARALSDIALRRTLGAAGRRWVEAHHALEAARRGQEAAVSAALGPGAGGKPPVAGGAV